MRGLTNRKTELGNDEIHQLRTAVVNGITDPEHRDFPQFIAKQKGFESEVITLLYCFYTTLNVPKHNLVFDKIWDKVNYAKAKDNNFECIKSINPNYYGEK